MTVINFQYKLQVVLNSLHHPKAKRNTQRRAEIERESRKRMVEVLESSFVVPSDETPKGRLWLSNLDQVAPRGFGGHVSFYNKSEATSFFSIEVLKASLAKALVLYYPLAGRYIVGSDGRVELDCNAEGCFFVRAQIERTFDSINFQPSQELEELFIPSSQMAGSPFLLLMIQVTYLKCGGVVLGFASNHVFADGQSMFHFIRTWASITRGDLSSIVPPSFDQTQLRARSPPIVKFDHSVYKANASMSTPTDSTTTKLRLSKEQVSSLNSRCNRGKVIEISTFCSVASLVWKCYCYAQNLAPDTTACLIFPVDIRSRLQPQLPKTHFSNAIVRKSVQSKVSKITSSPLQVVAESVQTAVKSVSDEYIRSYIDNLEIIRNEFVYRKESPESQLRVISICGMPLYDADFGWGPPQLVSRWKVTGNRVVFISNEPGENGGIELVVTIDSATMHRFLKMFHEELNARN
ncbi:HXXXD-type acyl-transferase family protein [Rhynchospora pubera]|uniref:HXXXD-type acyl-transferase family protein n=1 Tax=Rhynchospora pubera TaxID=906938 RepID=A0AAV8GDY1_9POAL|nr:HXXXD-type acyl-transferase family protein [Rhynchospora pubera]